MGDKTPVQLPIRLWLAINAILVGVLAMFSWGFVRAALFWITLFLALASWLGHIAVWASQPAAPRVGK